MDLRFESQLKRLEFIGALISEARVISWAEDLLLKGHEHNDDLCTLAFSKGFEEIEKALSKLSMNNFENDAFIWICNNYKNQLKTNLHNSSRILTRISFYSTNLDPKYSDFCSWLEAESDLIQNGYNDLDPAIKELTLFLDKTSTN